MYIVWVTKGKKLKMLYFLSRNISLSCLEHRYYMVLYYHTLTACIPVHRGSCKWQTMDFRYPIPNVRPCTNTCKCDILIGQTFRIIIQGKFNTKMTLIMLNTLKAIQRCWKSKTINVAYGRVQMVMLHLRLVKNDFLTIKISDTHLSWHIKKRIVEDRRLGERRDVIKKCFPSYNQNNLQNFILMLKIYTSLSPFSISPNLATTYMYT